MKWKLKHLRLAEDLVLCSSDFLQKTMINKNNWNIYLKAIHVCFCFCWNETNAMGRKSLTRRPNICRLRQIHTDWPTFFSSYNVHIHARAHLPSNCRRKKDNGVSSAFYRKAAPLDITNSIRIESSAEQSFRCSWWTVFTLRGDTGGR